MKKIASPLKEWLLTTIVTGGFFMLFLPLLGVLVDIVLLVTGHYPEKLSQQILFSMPATALIWLGLKTYFKMQKSRKAFIDSVSKSRSKFNINLMQTLTQRHAPCVSLKISLLADCCYFVGTIFMHHNILKLSEKVIRFITLHEIAHHLQYKTSNFACEELRLSLCPKESKPFIDLIELFGEEALLEVDADYYALKKSGSSVEDMRNALIEVCTLQGMALTGLTKEYLDLRIKCVEALLIESIQHSN